MVDVRGGVFTVGGVGGYCANPVNELDRPQGTGHVFMAIKADLFCPMAEFAERMAEMDRRAKSLPKAEGVERIMAPGEPEVRKERLNRERGLPLPPDVVIGLQAEADRKSTRGSPVTKAHIVWRHSLEKNKKR